MKAIFKTLCGCERRGEVRNPPYTVMKLPMLRPMRVSEGLSSEPPTTSELRTRVFELVGWYNEDHFNPGEKIAVYQEKWV